MHLRESRTSKFSGGACPRTPLGSKPLWAFGKCTRLLLLSTHLCKNLLKPLLIYFYLTFLLGMTFHTQRGNCSNIKKEICCHILGEKTLIKRFELSETKKEKKTKKKTLKSDSSYPLLKNWALKSVIQ